ncbi:hypothetical protein ABOM_008404 [Aspergillus bombycis]|uniref:Restriction endonuclease domain-containing protein n=1 Tax=Aspergillus bombycis TaxID=109264 RepID=A0A1F7ZSI8_9EURO|nr:hypothetical protein ABOM_008404 [Aspergillus bombycis]OGM42404.1 hypothetical protein ABOM_008404 [Aspergillus bombycis]
MSSPPRSSSIKRPDPRNAHSPVPSGPLLRSRASKSSPSATPQQLFYSLKKEIVATNGPAYFERDGIAPETGHLVARSLCEDGDVERKSVTISYNPISLVLSIKMPTVAHEAVQEWVISEVKVKTLLTGFFSVGELDSIFILGPRRYDSFPPPWNNIYKEPDVAITFAGVPLPMIAVEVGYTESWPKLLRDRDLWIIGGAPHVNAVLLVKWNLRKNNHVAGYLELHRPGVANPPRLVSIKKLFELFW